MCFLPPRQPPCPALDHCLSQGAHSTSMQPLQQRAQLYRRCGWRFLYTAPTFLPVTPQNKSRDFQSFYRGCETSGHLFFLYTILKMGKHGGGYGFTRLQSCQRLGAGRLACGSVAMWIPVWGMCFCTVHLDGSHQKTHRVKPRKGS